jgi:phospholipase D1/2
MYHFLIVYLLYTFQRNKAPNDPTIPLLMPQQHMITSNHSTVSDEINSRDNIHAPLLPMKISEMNRVEIDLGSLVQPNPRNQKNRGENLDQDLQMQAFVDEIRDKSQPLLGKNLHGSVLMEIEQGDQGWWEMQERGYQVDSFEESGQVGPRTSCHCQVK